MILKPFEQIEYEDIEQIVSRGFRENQFIEYKQTLSLSKDGEKKEALRDIVSFANARGGYIIVGIKSNSAGQPSEIIGIDDAEDLSSSLQNLCLSCIDERIFGLGIRVLSPSSPGRKPLLVMHIPESLNSPHMVKYEKERAFWRRYDDRKTPMTIQEIKESVIRGESLMNRIEKFLEEREKALLGKGRCLQQLSILPITFGEGLIDVFNQDLRKLISHPMKNPQCYWDLNTGRAEPFLYGAFSQGERCQLQLWSNGYLEYTCIGRLAGDPEQYIHGPILADNTLNFLTLAHELYSRTAILGPFILCHNFHDIKNLGLFVSDKFYRGIHDPGKWQEDNLKTPAIRINTVNPITDTKTLLDRFWNAFHFEECPYFDEIGDYTLWTKRSR